MEKYLAVLIASYFIADFLLQPDGLANKKRRPFYLFIHAVIHALATYILLQNWSARKIVDLSPYSNRPAFRDWIFGGSKINSAL